MAYNTKNVMAMTGLTQRRIDYWDTIHLIKPSIREAAGYGTTRLYSFNDLVQLTVVKALMDNRISLQKVRKAVIYLKKHFPDVKKPLAEMKFLTDGETVFALTKDRREILDALSRGQMVFSLAIGEIIENLKGKVAKISRDREYKVSVEGKSYKVVLHPDTEEGGYWVECPSLAGCDSQGDSVEEALAMIRDAIEGHLEVQAEKAQRKRATG